MHRAYRYGQSRPVYIYRLIAEGLEQCLYRQQARTLPPEPQTPTPTRTLTLILTRTLTRTLTLPRWSSCS